MSEDDKKTPILSPLGTRDYWDKLYADEKSALTKYEVVPEGWFGPIILHKMFEYIFENGNANSRFLDIGCGNGDTLIKLLEKGWKFLVGYDVSMDAVLLARNRMNSITTVSDELYFRTCNIDMLNMNDGDLTEIFDICFDKGTYDAICMSSDIDEDHKPKARVRYWENVYKILDKNGYVIIASCNWTAQEIVSQSENWFVLKKVIPTTTFSFGGSNGETVSICVLEKQ